MQWRIRKVYFPGSAKAEGGKERRGSVKACLTKQRSQPFLGGWGGGGKGGEVGGNVCGSFISVPKQIHQQSQGLPR